MELVYFTRTEVELIFQALVGDETGMVWLFLESIVVVTLLSIGLTALTKQEMIEDIF